MFLLVKVNFDKNAVLPIEQSAFLVLARNTIMLQHLIIHFPAIICQVVAYDRLQTKANFKLLASKWSRSLTRGSKYSDLLGNFCYFEKLIAGERWSQLVVRLYS